MPRGDYLGHFYLVGEGCWNAWPRHGIRVCSIDKEAKVAQNVKALALQVWQP